ncbi:MAG TPA: DMT family transporter [Gammaproteobacteria bacterium]
MRVLLAYLAVVLIWGTTPLAIQWSVEGVGAVFALSVRIAISLVLSYLWMRFQGLRMVFTAESMKIYFATVLGVFGAMMCVYWASRFIPSGLISVMFGLAPIVAGLFAWWLLQESFIRANKLLGACAGVVGLMVIFQDQMYLGPDGWKGMLGMLLSVTLYALSSVLIKRVGGGTPAVVVNTGGLLVTVPFFAMSWLASGQSWPDEIPLRAMAAIGYLAVFGSFAGFILFYYVLKRLPTGSVMLITLVTPVIALLLGSAVNGETPAVSAWAGAAVVLSGVLLYEWPAISQLVRKRVY